MHARDGGASEVDRNAARPVIEGLENSLFSVHGDDCAKDAVYQSDPIPG